MISFGLNCINFGSCKSLFSSGMAKEGCSSVFCLLLVHKVSRYATVRKEERTDWRRVVRASKKNRERKLENRDVIFIY